MSVGSVDTLRIGVPATRWVSRSRSDCICPSSSGTARADSDRNPPVPAIPDGPALAEDGPQQAESSVAVEHAEEPEEEAGGPSLEELDEDAILVGLRDAVRGQDLGESGVRLEDVVFDLGELVEQGLCPALLLGRVDERLGISAGDGEGLVVECRLLGRSGGIEVAHAACPPCP